MKVEVDVHTYIPVFSDGYGSAPAVIVLSSGVKKWQFILNEIRRITLIMFTNAYVFSNV